jgi:hypothetical protein
VKPALAGAQGRPRHREVPIEALADGLFLEAGAGLVASR